MISCKLEPLPKDQDVALRTWLSKEEVHSVILVVSAKIQHFETEALKDALAATAHNLKSESFETNMMKARRYNHFLEVLKELKERPITEPFEKSRLC